MVVALLALLGLLVSLYMLAYSLGFMGSVMCGLGDCATVQNSRYSWIGPIPVSGLGVAGYLTLLLVAILGIQPSAVGNRWVPAALLVGGVAGVGFSAYLTYLEAFVIHAWCQWCVTSAIIMLLAFLASLPEISRLGGNP
jgi:uncharacterized membrane protein